MTTLSKAAYARHRGVDRAHITRLGAAGRLVLTANGLVEVEASDRLIEATGGGRPDVASRHADARGEAKSGSDTEAGQGEKKRSKRESAKAAGVETLTEAKTRKERAQADQEEMKARQMAGDLISREDVEAAMRFIGGAVRAALEVFPDQTAPLVAPITDLSEAHELLRDRCNEALFGIGDAIERQKAELAKEGRA